MKCVGLDKLQNEIPEKVDLFLCCAGFEPRSKSVLLNLPSVKLSNINIFSYANDTSPIAMENINVMSKDKSVKRWQLMPDSPLLCSDILNNIMSGLPQNANVLIDLTSMTRELLLILLKLIISKFPRLNLSFYYVPSIYYSVGNEELRDISQVWLSRGVRQVRTILGFPGELSPVKKTMLVILPGFEEERVISVINAFEPDALLLGKVSEDESISKSSYQIHHRIVEDIKLKYEDQLKVSFFDFSCKKINLTQKALEQEILKYGDEYNMICCPMNTKLSSVAVGLVAHSHSKIQVCYASPIEYNVDNYSHEFPSSYAYVFSLEELMF